MKKPITYGMLLDYHIHPNYSVDAAGTIEEYCLQAIKLGITEICFTPHFEIDPVREKKDDRINLKGKIVSMRSDWIDYYFKEIEQAKKKFTDLSIKAGIEVGFDPLVESELKVFIKKYPFDLILGAIHCLNHTAITDHRELDEFIQRYAKKEPEQVANEYFMALDLAIRSGLFQVIAHFDVYKKYVLTIIGKELLAASELFLKPTLQLMANQGVGMEINTSGLRQNPKELYPAAAILKKAKKAGVKIFTIGSDAHQVTQLGFGLQQGLTLTKKLGLNLYGFEKGKPIPRFR